MVRKLLISDVSPGEKDWTCKVCVVKKLDAQDSKTTPGNKYRPIILQDEAGYKVQAMTYANEIDIFDNKLSLNATYIITDATVSIPRGNLVLPDERYNCLWTLTRKCTVIAAPDEDRLQVIEEPEMDEISFSHFHKYINTMKKISVMAIVIHKLPRKHVDSKNGKIDAADFVLVDKQAKPVIFTLWGKYAQVEGVELEKQLTIGNFPVILAKNVEVTNYSGLSLSTRFGSVIELNIATPTSEELGQWALSNSVTLQSLILTNAFNDAYLKLVDLSSEQFVTIADVKSSIIEGKRYCIYASIKIPIKVKKFYYIACDGCWKGTTNNLGEEFECSYCGNSMAVAKPRCMMIIELTENNDFLESILFGNIVEELPSLSASKLVDMDKKNESIDMQNVN
ncbi:replication protein A 70 kDa DNA-binding subunit B-like [Ipomoea triloba]|uniref:replication protein A 70 kDa DNA-binding subunit B-like n=1 Tax=Ipomoea triloba TaxID=35885 RepID=UPI00125CDE7A|nr:replication protein A 70 kDa DNA-binding subunit B-like [Ipomoea triloba]